MRSKIFFKNPILTIGILLFTIFILNASRKGIFKMRAEKLKPTSCKSVLVKLERRIPESWKASCEDELLNVAVNNPELDAKNLINGETSEAAIYKELANILVSIAKKSPNDNLERTNWIKVTVESPDFILIGIVEGKNLAKLANSNHPKFIADHLQSFVQTQIKAK